jgi:hypothetical protein
VHENPLTKENPTSEHLNISPERQQIKEAASCSDSGWYLAGVGTWVRTLLKHQNEEWRNWKELR